MGPNPRAFTKTGKSLKAVRRYYAIKAAAEKNRNQDDGSSNARKKARSPDDEKLSKRIAAELRTQKEAIQMRAKNEGIAQGPTLSTVPLIQQPESAQQQGAPTFVAEIRPFKTAAPKSTKSVRSGGTMRDILDNIDQPEELGSSVTGCFVACFMISLVYLGALVVMVLEHEQPIIPIANTRSIYQALKWIGISSIAVLVAIPYFLMFRSRFIHAMISLILMTVNCASLCANLIYYMIVNTRNEFDDYRVGYIYSRFSVNFWLPIINLILQITAIGYMVKQNIGLITTKLLEHKRSNMDENNTDRMSIYLAPT